MIRFNLSVDFELGWGDLRRVTHDAAFRQRVLKGLEQTPAILAALARSGIPSTWGVVGACCAGSIEELRERAPAAFSAVGLQLATLTQRRHACREVLFCRDAVAAIAQSAQVELASHGFLHLVPTMLPLAVLQSDVAASVASLRTFCAGALESFIPPQNYHWPDEAFVGSSMRYVRHTPSVGGYEYSDPRKPAKVLRLWNDLVRPVGYANRDGESAWLLFLRIDRGARLWEAQLRLIRRLLVCSEGSLYCFTHPHNLDSAVLVRRFGQLCEAIGEAAGRGAVTFTRFFRKLPRQHVPAVDSWVARG
jgi:peptidoglycan/xylan/chitin deacetylase (PgdA/CDA1 family)